MTKVLKPLEWREATNFIVADSQFGPYTIWKSGDSLYWWHTLHDGLAVVECSSIEAGKAACFEHYNVLIESLFEGTE